MTEEKKEARGDAAVANAGDAAKGGAAATAAGVAGAAPAAKPNPLPALLGIAGGALVVGAALGFFLVAPRVVAARAAAPAKAHAEKTEKKGDKAKASKPATYRMDNIIVNPAGSNGTRFLMASVAIELDDAKIGETLHDKDVELRDAVISTIEKQSLEAITRPGARDSLRNQLVVKLAPIIGATPRVFLPQFVLQ